MRRDRHIPRLGSGRTSECLPVRPAGRRPGIQGGTGPLRRDP